MVILRSTHVTLRIVCDSGGKICTEHDLSLKGSSPHIVGVDKYALSCELTCEMCLGKAEASRPVLCDSAANKRRCNPVTVAYPCSNRAATRVNLLKTGGKRRRANTSICRYFVTREISSRLSDSLCTAEVGGSNPPGSTPRRFRHYGPLKGILQGDSCRLP